MRKTMRRRSLTDPIATSKPEARVVKLIVELLERSGWLVRITSQPHRITGGLVGFPDLIAFKHDHVLLVEVKAPGESRRPSQERFALDLVDHIGPHVLYLVADDVEQVEHRLLLMRW